MGILSFFKTSASTEIVKAGFELADCDANCDDCHSKFPLNVKFQDDDGAALWKSTKPYGLHLVVSTGRTDWTHDALEDKSSVEGVLDKFLGSYKFPDGAIKVSVSSRPSTSDDEKYRDVLILPFFVWVKNVTTDNVVDVLEKLLPVLVAEREKERVEQKEEAAEDSSVPNGDGNGTVKVNQDSSEVLASLSTFSKLSLDLPFVSGDFLKDDSKVDVSVDNAFAYVFLCSHTTRDKRCGITAPIMKKEFELHLRDHDLYRDASDTRPGGVKIDFINHVGGHKFAANLLMYVKQLGKNIWLARCKPNNVKPIIEESLLLGKVWPEKVRIVQQFKGIDW